MKTSFDAESAEKIKSPNRNFLCVLCVSAPSASKEAYLFKYAAMTDTFTGTRPVTAQDAFDTARLAAWMQEHVEGFSGGVSDDFPLAAAYAHARTLRFADGPDEVHRNAIAKQELGRYASQSILAPPSRQRRLFRGKSKALATASGTLARPSPASIEPDDRSHDEDQADAARDSGDAAIQVEDVPAAENLGPVVVPIADQGQFLRPRVGHVARNVEQVCSEPDDGTGNPRRIFGTMKMDRGSEGKGELKQGAAVDCRPRAEQSHQGMPGLMQGQIRAVQ